MVANVVGVKISPGMDLGQWWRLWTCGKDGLQRNLCEGSEMSRPSMVEMETAKLERGGERQMAWPTPTRAFAT